MIFNVAQPFVGPLEPLKAVNVEVKPHKSHGYILVHVASKHLDIFMKLLLGGLYDLSLLFGQTTRLS